MRYLILAAALTVLAAPVYAQSMRDTSSSNSSSTSGSTSMGTGGYAGVNFNYAVTDPPANNTTNTLRNNTPAPDVVINGANACGLPVGASTSIMGFGFGVGATPTDKGCEHRDDAAAMHALGHDDVAIGIMCEQKDVADAMAATGHACPPVGQPPSEPVAATQPIPTGDMNANMNNEVAVPPAPAPAGYVKDHQDWCEGLNPNSHEDKPYIMYDCQGVRG